MPKVPDYKYTVPSEQHYFDESTSTSTAARVFVANKTGADYGIKDPDFFVVAVDAITVSPTTKSLAVAATQQITVTPTGADVTYTSSDPTKATVSSTGLITGVAAGTAIITVQAKEGKGVATVAVTVTA